MALFNGTTHEISMYAKSDTYEIQGGRKLIVKEGATPIKVIPAGKNLNAVSTTFDYDNEVEGVPVKGMEFVSVDNPYERFEGAIYGDNFIVSNLYRAAARELGVAVPENHLLTVGNTVYSDETNTRPCGCLYFVAG